MRSLSKPPTISGGVFFLKSAVTQPAAKTLRRSCSFAASDCSVIDGAQKLPRTLMEVVIRQHPSALEGAEGGAVGQGPVPGASVRAPWGRAILSTLLGVERWVLKRAGVTGELGLAQSPAALAFRRNGRVRFSFFRKLEQPSWLAGSRVAGVFPCGSAASCLFVCFASLWRLPCCALSARSGSSRALLGSSPRARPRGVPCGCFGLDRATPLCSPF